MKPTTTTVQRQTPRYGRRKITSMLADWNALRAAVANGDVEATQAAFDRCEEWIDFAFGSAREEG